MKIRTYFVSNSSSSSFICSVYNFDNKPLEERVKLLGLNDCISDARKMDDEEWLQNLLSETNRNINVMELAGGFKAMSYNGIPIVVDRFCPKGTMYMLNTNDFTLHQLCDWKWLEGEDGRVIKQVADKPVYKATLVKYADLICSRPCGQAMLTGILEA